MTTMSSPRSRRPPGLAPQVPPLLSFALVAVVIVVVVVVVVGCKSSGGSGDASSKSAGGGGTGGTGGAREFNDATAAEMRIEAMAAADGYVTTIAQALDELRAHTKRPEIARWALENKIATGTAVFTNATQAGDGSALLDMLVYSTLKRQAVEDYWLPKLLGPEDGAAVLDAHRHGEQEVWARGGKMLTRKQLDELKGLIDQWRRDHPTQYYVSHVRLADMLSAQHLTRGSPQLKLPGSVFGLLYMDPLSGLDPMAAELHSYRALTERMMFLVQRMPLVLGAQVDQATLNATSTPEVIRFVTGVENMNERIERFTKVTERFTNATTRVTQVAASYPKELSTERSAAVEQVAAVTATERSAAINQVAAAVAAERKAIIADLDAQDSRLRRITDDMKGVLARADQAGVSINAATTQTVTAAELSTRRTLDRAFWLVLTLILVLLVGIPASAIVYRLVTSREARLARRTASDAAGAAGGVATRI